MALEIGKCRLRSIRRSANMKQRELCEKLKELGIEVTVSYISNLENNRGTPASHMHLVAFSIIFEKPMDSFYVYRW